MMEKGCKSQSSPNTPLKSGLRRARTRAENPTVTLVVLEQWARTDGVRHGQEEGQSSPGLPSYGRLTVEADP
ncbi:unnamed protein product [Boreogadus saida]